MGQIFDETDWSATALGPRARWPLALRLAVDLILASRFPMSVAWGEERILLYNDAYAEILGARHPEALGRPMQEVWPEAWPELGPLVARSFGGEAVWREDMLLTLERHGYPEPAWFTFSFSPLRDGLGAVCGMLNTVVETTGRQRLEASLRHSEARHRALLESIGDGFFVLDRHWRFSYVNPQGARILGRPVEEMLGAVIWDAFPGLVASRFEAVYRRVAETRAMGTERAFYPDQGRWYEVRAFPAEPGGISVFVRDVSEEVRKDEALRRSETRYRSLSEASSQLVWTLDGAQRMGGGQPGWEAFTGQDKAARSGMGWLEAVHPDHRGRLLHLARAAVEEGQAYEAEFVLRRHDGAWRTLRARGVPVRDAEGAVVEWVGSGADVTEQRLTEGRLALAMEGTSDGLWDWNIVSGESFHSPRIAAMLGHAPEEWDSSHENWLRTIHPEDRPAVETRLHEHLAGETEDYSATYRVRHRDGRWLWILSRARALRDVEGCAIRLVGAHTDITAQKEAETALAEREARLRVMADAMPQIVWWADPSGHTLWYNRRWHEFTGIPRTDVAPPPEERLHVYHPEDLPVAQERWRHSLRTGEPYEVEYRFRDAATGQWRWHLGRALPARDAEGRITAWVGTATDIHDQRDAREILTRSHDELERLVAARTSELMRAEAALRHSERLQAMGQLTGSIAHDFSNVLQVVDSGIHLLASEELSGEERLEVADGVGASLENARRMTRQLLAFARQQPLEPATLDLNARLRAMRELLRHSLGQRIALKTEFAEGLPPVTLDPAQLETALLNLVMNARDAMPEGGTLTLSTAMEDGRVALTVADTGEGMPPEVLERLFEPFFTTKPAGKGTGLGLAQVHGFLAQSGGEVRVESTPGAGSRFTLLLPS
ncbi:PAS domain-containing sensor histidine kinase [Sabulicella glaciei]|uniref:histidine kinase n=1 Tax=Sabulicella glaciei TaxID=2984948 RepID=A0ABT3NY34_9PROT|nr:PAS domain S-box protein [Roseococcus sp. MDT2-1-1]MCW8087043.1 PAS domain S-box protein [Roseococcus sp. MDT2-1-1]